MPSLPTAFVSVPGARVRLDGGVLLVEHPEQPPVVLQLGQLGGLVVLGRVEVSTAAQLALAERGLACVYASRSGRLRAVVHLPSTRHFTIRARQHALEAQRQRSDCDAEVVALVLETIEAKVDAMLGLLVQHHRTHADVELSEPIDALRALRQRAALATSIDELRGFEGAAAARYFGAMPALCRAELTTATRSRRPPRDALNALFSFGYSLLAGEVTAAILARGLDPMLGLLHPPAANRPSLALDLMEPMRHAIIDRLVLRAANRREIVLRDFEPVPDESGGIRCTDEGRAKFLALYHSALSAPITAGGGTARTARDLIALTIDRYEVALKAPPDEAGSSIGLSETASPAVTGDGRIELPNPETPSS